MEILTRDPCLWRLAWQRVFLSWCLGFVIPSLGQSWGWTVGGDLQYNGKVLLLCIQEVWGSIAKQAGKNSSLTKTLEICCHAVLDSVWQVHMFTCGCYYYVLDARLSLPCSSELLIETNTSFYHCLYYWSACMAYFVLKDSFPLKLGSDYAEMLPQKLF